MTSRCVIPVYNGHSSDLIKKNLMGLTLDLVNTATLDVICLRCYEYSKLYRLFLSTESSTQASVSLADGKGSQNTVYFFIY